MNFEQEFNKLSTVLNYLYNIIVPDLFRGFPVRLPPTINVGDRTERHYIVKTALIFQGGFLFSSGIYFPFRTFILTLVKTLLLKKIFRNV